MQAGGDRAFNTDKPIDPAYARRVLALWFARGVEIGVELTSSRPPSSDGGSLQIGTYLPARKPLAVVQQEAREIAAAMERGEITLAQPPPKPQRARRASTYQEPLPDFLGNLPTTTR